MYQYNYRSHSSGVNHVSILVTMKGKYPITVDFLTHYTLYKINLVTIIGIIFPASTIFEPTSAEFKIFLVYSS